VSVSRGRDRGRVVVCMPAPVTSERLALDRLARTLRSVLAHTEPDVATIVYDDSSPPSPTRGLVEALAAEHGREIQFAGPGEEGAGERTLRAVLTALAPADVALVDSGCTVTPGWLAGLRDAAYSDSTVATVSALIPADIARVDASDSASGSDVEFNLDRAAPALGSKGVPLRPRLPAARRPCVYVRRSALELDPESEIEPHPPNAIDAGFSRSCLESGLSHVLADDVLVDPGEPAAYPRLELTECGDGPLARAVGGARRAVLGLSALVDARILSGPQTGTHLHVLELVAGLARTEKVNLTAVIPDEPNEYAVTRLNDLAAVRLITYEEASKLPGGQADLVHRPFQLTNAGDLTFLERLGDRLLLTQQDLIAFHNPSYFASDEAWTAYRHLNRLAMARADQVVFFSDHTREDAIAQELVEPTRASVVRLGVDHTLADTDRALARPAGASRMGEDRPAILCIGTDYRHKNRIFALRVLERLLTAHGWDGVLVFAGARVQHGSSRAREHRFIAGHPGLADRVLDLGPVSEAEKRWLFARSALVLYPTVLEGFGLVPFEAAEHRVPCMWAPGSSLSELLGDDAAEIVPWDAEGTAERALALMRRPEARERNLAATRAGARALTWDATAEALVGLYRATCDASASTARIVDPTPALAQGTIGEDAMRLVGPGGELPPDLHRPLLALATHPRLAAPLFAALKAGYRASHELARHRRRR
jgi:glycosyltransferase involved in cell wall biosynthesis